MIIKEKRWLSRFVAMLCVLTMVVGVLTPASYGMAKETSVSKMYIKIVNGLEYESSNGSNMLATDTEQEDDIYKYKKSTNKDGYIEIIELNNGQFETTDVITFYINGTPNAPSIEAENARVTVTSAGSNSWQVDIKIKVTAEDELEIIPRVQYSVTYSESTDYKITADNDEVLSGLTKMYDSDTDVKFKVVATDSQRKNPVVSVNGDKVTCGEDGYYTIKGIDSNKRVVAGVEDKKLAITVKDDVEKGYTCTAVNGAEVVYGGDYSFYVNPKPGFKTPTVYVYDTENGEKGNALESTGNNQYSINGIDKAKTIEIESGDNEEYDVIFEESTGYSVSCSGATDGVKKANHNDTLGFSVSCDPGYTAPRVTVNGGVLQPSTTPSPGEAQVYSYTTGAIIGNTTIAVTGKKLSYQVTLDTSAIGNHDEYTVSASDETIEHGGKYTFYVESKTGYSEPIVKYGKNKDSAKEVAPVNGAQYVITITEPTTIFITPGELNEYDITYNKAVGYDFYKPDSTSEPAIDKVKHNETLEFILHVQKPYSNSTPVVSVGGKNQDNPEPSEADDGGKNYKYTVENITSDQIVTVSGIQKNTYKVKLPASNPKYTVTTTDVTNVTAESSFTFHVSINLGYKKGNDFKITAGGKEFTEPGECTIESVESDITITIEGIEDETFAAVKDNEHVKEIKGNGDCDLDLIKYGEALEFTVTPSDYYRVTQVAVDGVEVNPVGGVYTVKNITSTPTIKVETVANKLTVKYVDEKYNKNSKTIEYSVEYSETGYGSVAKESGKVTLYVPVNTKLYNFDGWYDEDDSKQTEMQIPMDADNEITLTAKWLLNNDAVKEGITLKTDSHWEQKVSSDGYNFKMLAKTTLEMLEELDEEYKSNVSITGYGTLYSNKAISNCEQYTTRIKGRQRNNTESLVKDSVGNSTTVWSFYANVDYNIEDIQKNVNDYFYLKIDSKQEQERYAIGWLELTVDGEHIIIYAASSEGENGKVKSAVGQ